MRQNPVYHLMVETTILVTEFFKKIEKNYIDLELTSLLLTTIIE